MKVLQVGLGSMGKRRIRCMQGLGYDNIVGFDLRGDRRREAEKLYGITTVGSLDDVDMDECDAFIISVPPDKHIDYMKVAVAEKVPAFIEASVVIDGLEDVDREARQSGVLMSPSCTMRFHPAIKDIKKIVSSGRYGEVTSFSYHCGQYLPDWHPWERVSDYYVSKKETGGGKEIVAFELTWIVDILGLPEKIKGIHGKTMDVGADIDDTYVLSMKFKNAIGSMIVDVVSRYAMRSLILNMENGQIQWRWDRGQVNLYESDARRWIEYKQEVAPSHDGYNTNINERMYVEEIERFFTAAKGGAAFPHTLSEDMEVLKILYGVEGEFA